MPPSGMRRPAMHANDQMTIIAVTAISYLILCNNKKKTQQKRERNGRAAYRRVPNGIRHTDNNIMNESNVQMHITYMQYIETKECKALTHTRARTRVSCAH